MEEKVEKARKFCKEVRNLAEKYDVPFIVVTDGASAISNNGCAAALECKIIAYKMGTRKWRRSL